MKKKSFLTQIFFIQKANIFSFSLMPQQKLQIAKAASVTIIIFKFYI